MSGHLLGLPQTEYQDVQEIRLSSLSSAVKKKSKENFFDTKTKVFRIGFSCRESSTLLYEELKRNYFELLDPLAAASEFFYVGYHV